MMFCTDNRELLKYELMMQQCPNYRKRNSDVVVMKKVNAKNDIEENASDNMTIFIEVVDSYNKEEGGDRELEKNDREDIFASDWHREVFTELINDFRFRCAMRKSGNYFAALFLLTSDEDLWCQVRPSVKWFGIFFDEMHIHDLNEDQYARFMQAREFYDCKIRITESDRENKDLISDDTFRLIMTAICLKLYGADIFLEKESDSQT